MEWKGYPFLWLKREKEENDEKNLLPSTPPIFMSIKTIGFLAFQSGLAKSREEGVEAIQDDPFQVMLDQKGTVSGLRRNQEKKWGRNFIHLFPLHFFRSALALLSCSRISG